MSKVTQRFIVGTGRCGSTLLSTLMSHHPDALILSEFFGGLDVVNSWRKGQVSGEEFASVLIQDHEISNLNRMRLHKDREVLLDVDRFASVRIPAIMLVCLPALTPDVEGLMREIVAFARSRPTATMGALRRVVRLAHDVVQEAILDRALGRFERVLPRPARRISRGAIPSHPPRRPRSRDVDGQHAPLPDPRRVLL
jgi:putative sulfotransferase